MVFSTRSLLTLVVLVCAGTSASAQALKVLTAGAFKPVVMAVAPGFEAATGSKVEIVNDTAGALVARIRAGEDFDVLILPPSGFDAIAGEHRIDAATVRPLAKVAIGVAVKAGAAVPPLDTVEQFKDALLRARKVAYIDPASGGSSGVYLDGLFRRLGIADAVRAKAVLVPGGLVADRVARDEADLAIHQVSEILPVTGVTLAGWLPESIQSYTTYACAISSRSPHAARAAAFIAALGSSSAAGIMRAKGMTALP